MAEFINNISGNVLALAIVGGSIISIVSVVCGCVYSIRRASLATQLKQDMLDRGMSADEIKTVLEAGVKQ